VKIMIAGDTHGSMPHAESLFKWGVRHHVERIIQVGDFGYLWPDKEKPLRRIKRLSAWAEQYGIPFWWLDGNHDNFDLMTELGAFGADEPVEMFPGVTYLPRGSRFEAAGLSFAALGGAVSIDKNHRISNEIPDLPPHKVSWWHQETIKDEDVDKLIAGGPVDVLLSHDAPDSQELLEFLRVFGEYHRIAYKIDAESQANREQMNRAVDTIQPKFLFHGHYHHRYNGERGETKIVGLGRDGDGTQSYVVVDTDLFPWSYK
jgi:predicted phosphodiesterase